jgi:hypothetical protein
VAGDDKYGDRTFNELLRGYGLHRMFLHSSAMGFTRPGTREPMQVSAPLPEELSAVIDQLQRGKARAPEGERGRALKPAGRRPQQALPQTRPQVPLRERPAERTERPAPKGSGPKGPGFPRGAKRRPPRSRAGR